MKLDSPLELGQPVIVSLVRRVVIKDDMDFVVLRLISQHSIQKGPRILAAAAGEAPRYAA